MSKVTNIDAVRIGRIMRLERKMRDLSQTDVATAIGCKQAIFSLYESGERRIPANRVAAIAAVFGLDQRIINPEAAR